MKKIFNRMVVTAMIFAMMVSSVAFAADARASAYIASKGGGIIATGGGEMLIEFSVTATGMMDKVGASAVHIYNDATEDLEATIRYTDPGCSGMMTTNDFSWDGEVTWEGVPGERYYAVITFYAKNSSGYDYRGFVTTAVQV